MAQVLNTNMASLVAQRNLSASQSMMTASVEKLSSGMRINRAKDDSAGLGISQALTAQIKTVDQSARNAADAISVVQTAEGALSEVSSMLQRMKELSTQGANAALSGQQRSFIADEIDSLKSEINKVAERTTFNGLNLLTSTSTNATSSASITTTITAKVSTSGSEANGKVSFGALTGFQGGTTLNFTVEGGTAKSFTVTSEATLAEIASAITADKANLGVTAAVDSGNLVLTADPPPVASSGVAKSITAASGTLVTAVSPTAPNFEFQVGFAAGTDTIELSGLTDIRINGSNGNSANGATFNQLASAISTFKASSSVDNAQALMAKVDNAISKISGQRANLGAQQNRLDHNINNLKAQSENLSDARSRVLDTDYAAETAQMTKTQIMQQAATAMLAQANQQPNVILSLLK